MVKRTLKRILVCILIILILNNFFITNISNAAIDAGETLLVDLLGSVIGIFAKIPSLIAIGLSFGLQALVGAVAYVEGGAIGSSGAIADPTTVIVTPFHIFFNKIAILDINFFTVTTDSDVITEIRSGIAAWYYIMRNIAAAILLVVLIYVGIRMAISTIASDQAKYKKMLVDWMCSLALIFLLHYVIIFTVHVNSAFISALASVGEDMAIEEAIKGIRDEAIKSFGLNGIAATVVYCMFVIQTLGLVISYFSRMLKLAFLTIISPLITLTYSIDKMGDGKAQALGAWLKEFIYTVLIQPFHCIIYMVFINMAFGILSGSGSGAFENSIAGSIMAILCLRFTKEAEKILGTIFKFGEHTSESSIGVGMAASAMALSKAKSIGKGTRAAVNKLGNAKGSLRNARVDLMALTAKRKDADGNKVSYAQRREDARNELEARDAEKYNKRHYSAKTRNNMNADAIKKKADEIMKANPGMNRNDAYKQAKDHYDVNKRAAAMKAADPTLSTSSAMAKARADIARETRDGQQQRWIHRKISGARSFGRKYSALTGAAKSFVISQITGGIALWGGSSTYGATGNIETSVMTAMTLNRGGKEFLTTTSTNLRNDVHNRLESLGVPTGAADSALNQIIGKGNGGQYSDKEMKELLRQIEQALIAAGMDKNTAKNTKFSIRNTIERDLTENPNANVGQVVQNALNAWAPSQSGDAGVQSAAQNIGNFVQEKTIYEDIKSISDIGYTPERFVDDVSDTYSNEAGSSTPPTTSSATYTTRDFGAIERDSIVNQLEKDIEQLYDRINAGGNEAEVEKEIRDLVVKLREFQEEIDDIKLNPKYTAELQRQVHDVREEVQTMIHQVPLPTGGTP